jgi:hypothetical protein
MKGGKQNMKKENKKAAASTPETDFDITIYPKEDYTTSKGEEKTRYILPDEVFWEHLKEIPDGTINESRTRRAAKNGALKILGSEPEKDRKIQKAGGEALQATIRQRKTFREDFLALLAQKADNGKTRQENIVISMADRADLGDVKAAQFIRDTIGEKPADTVDLNANVMTEADKALIDKLKARMIQE